MIVKEDYSKGNRQRLFRFREKDVKIIVEGREYEEYEIGIDKECEEFYKKYDYNQITEAFRDFIELVKKEWSNVQLRIERKENPELYIIFDKHYFITDFVVQIDDLCKDSEKLKAIYKKLEELQDILKS